MKVVFLDRDGTIIVDPPDNRIDSIQKIQLFPDTIEALTTIAQLGYGIILITNQAGIAEGRITEQKFWQIHNEILKRLAPSGIAIRKTYLCPHRPADNCNCRKPKPAMLLQAAEEFAIDLPHSWFIGDRETDIQAGHAAGTKTILVQTANTRQDSGGATYSAPHLLDAVRYIQQA